MILQTAKLLLATYRGRRDTFVVENLKTGDMTRVFNTTLTPEVVAKHLEGELFLHTYYMVDSDRCFNMSFDFDIPDFSIVTLFWNYIRERYGWNALVSTSRRKGYHLDIAVAGDTPVEAGKAKAFMEGVKSALGYGYTTKVETFPHSHINRDEGPGKSISLPLAGHYVNQNQRTLFLDMPQHINVTTPLYTLVDYFQKRRVMPEELNNALMDLNAQNVLTDRHKALIPALFPEEAARFAEEERAREAASLKAKEELRTKLLVREPTQGCFDTANAMLNVCGTQLIKDLYDDISYRIRVSHTPCLCNMFEGATEGTRDEVCFRLAIHLRKQFELPAEVVQLFLLEWNQRTQPPLPAELVKRKIDYVYRKQYSSLGCDNSIVRAYCNGVCPYLKGEDKIRQLDRLKELNPVVDAGYESSVATPPITPTIHQDIAIAPDPAQLVTSDSTLMPSGYGLAHVTSAQSPLASGTMLEKVTKEVVNPAGTVLDDTTDPIYDKLYPGFTLDLSSGCLVYTDELLVLKMTRVDISHNSVKAQVTLIYSGQVINTDKINLHTSSSRRRLCSSFRKENKDLAAKVDVALLHVLKQLEVPDLANVLRTHNQKKVIGAVTDNEQALTVTQGEMTYVTAEQHRGISVECDYTIENGISYIEELNALFLFVVCPITETRQEKDVDGNLVEKTVQTWRVGVLDSAGGWTLVTSPVKSQKGYVDCVDIRRLVKPFENVVLPITNLSAFFDRGVIWRTSDMLAFREAKSKGIPPRHVDIVELANRIRNIYKTYVYFRDEENYSINAVWDLLTYCHKISNTFPILYLNGNKGSGKSTVLKLKERICFNAINFVNATESTIFRIVDNLSPTLLLDEKEDISQKGDGYYRPSTMHTLLNSSYQKGAKVPRTDMDNGGIVKFYSPYGPKVIANITGCDSVILDRAIQVNMVKAESAGKMLSPLDPNDREETEKFQDLRDDIYTWLMSGGYAEYKEALAGGDYRVLSKLQDRDLEVYGPPAAFAEMLAKKGDSSFFKDVISSGHKATHSKKASKESEMSHIVAMAIAGLLKEGDKPGELGHLPAAVNKSGVTRETLNNPEKRIFKAVRSMPDGSQTRKIRLIEWDIVHEVSKFRPDPETLMSSSGFLRIRQELKTHGLISAFGVDQTRVVVQRLVKKPDTGNLEVEEFRGLAYYIPEDVLSTFIKTELRRTPSRTKEPEARR